MPESLEGDVVKVSVKIILVLVKGEISCKYSKQKTPFLSDNCLRHCLVLLTILLPLLLHGKPVN